MVYRLAQDRRNKLQDIYEFKSPDAVLTTSRMLREDGQWVTFMWGEAERVK